MYQYQIPRYFPPADELPCSDDTPVDNELQELIPSLLKSILQILWKDRMDCFFGIDMAIYTDPEQPPLAQPLPWRIVPDGFLSLNVERVFDRELRSCYALWEEEVPPILVLEIVSKAAGGEYLLKPQEYARLGVLYYAIYSLEKVLHLGKPQDRTFRNPKRRRKPTLEIHKLVNGSYELQPDNPLWMPEIGLGIGSEQASYGALMREWVYWYDENNRRYPTPEEQIELADRRAELERQQTELANQRAEQESQRAEQESQRAERLAAQLRALGIEPN